MPTARITAVMLDGSKLEGTSVYMPLADRVAFEHRFGRSVFKELENVKEEEAAYFSWRILERAGQPVGSFEEFLDSTESLEVELLDGPADPTDAAPLPGT